MRRRPAGRASGRMMARRAVVNPRGSILIEVLVATILMGLIVVPLGTSLAGSLDRARETQKRAGAEAGEQSSPAYEWGPRVVSAWWRPGPVLHVQADSVSPGNSGDVYLGLWVDGWLIGEEVLEAGGTGEGGSRAEAEVPSARWIDLAGKELVARVRRADGVWGPPWRLAVPDVDGGTPGIGTEASAEGSEAEGVIHRPGTGTSSATVSWSPVSVPPGPFQLLFSLRPPTLGWAAVTLGSHSQWWRAEEGRSADLYY